MRLVSRTAIEADLACQEKYRWLQEAHGHGIVPMVPAFDLDFGEVVHKGLEDLAKYGRIEKGRRAELQAVATACSERPDDVVSLGLGLLLAYERAIWPRVVEEYEVILVEGELTVPVPGADLAIMVKPDLVLRRRKDGLVFYEERKTASSPDTAWLTSWETSLQLQLGMKAVADYLDEPVEGAYVQGFDKGTRRDGVRRSLFTYAYMKEGRPGLTTDQWSPHYQKGVLTPVGQYEGGIEGWVASRRAEELQAQFVRSALIPLDERELARDLKSQEWREWQLQMWRDGEIPLEAAFRRNRQHCQPPRGYACPYVAACWSPQVKMDPIGSGLYKVREPHHQMERLALGLDEKEGNVATGRRNK